MKTIHTPRLTLRKFSDKDKPALFDINGDALVMEHFPAPLSRHESDAMVDKIIHQYDEKGMSFQAVCLKDGPLIGLAGLAHVNFEAHFTPCVEIGWRIHRQYWRQGYAFEACQALLAHGFDALGLEEIVAFTIPENIPSIRLMQKLGMKTDPAWNFVRKLGPLSLEHVLYRIRKG